MSCLYSLCQGYCQGNAGLIADAAGDVPMAVQIFGDQHVARVEAAFCPVGGFKFRYS
jgi:hypothetical protein